MAYGSVNVPGRLPNKQDKLTGQPGQVVGFDGMGLAYAVPGWSNPNLLDNWYFADPVNQRGQVEYAAAGYTIDRWRMDIDIWRIEVADDGLLLDASANAITFFQTHEAAFSELMAGRTVTLSVLYEAVTELTSETAIMTNSHGAASPLRNQFQLISPAGQENCKSITFMYDSDITQPVWVYIKKGEKAKIKAVKLELGSQQTLAHQDADGNWVLNDPPPDKALELAKCQRYFEIVPFEWNHRSGVAYSENTAVYKATKRANPIVQVISMLGNPGYISYFSPESKWVDIPAYVAYIDSKNGSQYGVRAITSSAPANLNVVIAGHVIADANL